MPLVQLTQRCWYLPSDSRTDRPALGYIVGENTAFAVDAGNSPDHFALLCRAAQEASLPELSVLALTHYHWDHTFGLCAAQVPSYANVRTQSMLQTMCRWGWTLPAMERRLRTHEDILFCHQYMLLEYPDVTQIRVRMADHTFDGMMDIDCGGVQVRLLCWPSSHTDDCTVVYVPGDKVLYLGDICYTDLNHDPECIHRRRYAQLAEALSQCDFDIAVPAHHDPVDKRALMLEMEERLAEPGLLMLDD